VGGSMSFGGATVQVGAIAPDDAVGWSELLVNRDIGQRLGIEHERYLLAFGDDGLTLPRFTSDVRSLIPSDSDLRTVPPGGTRYVRVASGVNPPVVFKQVFGEFDAYPRTDDPVYLNMDHAWYETHIQTRNVPIFTQPVTCNRAFFPALVGALKDVQAAGLASEIHTYSGCYAARTVARSSIAPPSNHAYGAAIDINAPENPYGGTPTMDPRIVRIFEKWGFIWGGRFLIPDGMHFEYGSAPSA
jgi:D-alanyl-D-alanine carboxypeptidase